MRLLVLGGTGMAGHVIVRHFRERTAHEVLWTARGGGADGAMPLDARDFGQVERLLAETSPDAVINAIGVLNEEADRNEANALLLNGRLPQRLRTLLDGRGGRLVHISTDCVFSGARGGYAEDDAPDGTSAYARTKALGESRDARHLTIRTSIVGPEIRPHGIGLLRWFMAQTGEVPGYTNVPWNGVTTLELAKAIERFLAGGVSGLVHLTAAETISKYELLRLFARMLGKEDVTVVPDGRIRLDRTLVSTRRDLPYAPVRYEAMLRELGEWMRSA